MTQLQRTVMDKVPSHRPSTQALCLLERRMDEIVTMYRPIGPKELKLLEGSGFRRWPPGLPGQPMLYPVSEEK